MEWPIASLTNRLPGDIPVEDLLVRVPVGALYDDLARPDNALRRRGRGMVRERPERRRDEVAVAVQQLVGDLRPRGGLRAGAVAAEVVVPPRRGRRRVPVDGLPLPGLLRGDGPLGLDVGGAVVEGVLLGREALLARVGHRRRRVEVAQGAARLPARAAARLQLHAVPGLAAEAAVPVVVEAVAQAARVVVLLLGGAVLRGAREGVAAAEELVHQRGEDGDGGGDDDGAAFDAGKWSEKGMGD